MPSNRNGAFSLEDESKDQARPTQIDLSKLMRVIQSDPALTTLGEIASKLRRTHGTKDYQFETV